MIPGYLTGQVRDRPQIGDYTWRARRYPVAEQALRRAMAEHGTEAIPTCLCGGRIRAGGRCGSCGQVPG